MGRICESTASIWLIWVTFSCVSLRVFSNSRLMSSHLALLVGRHRARARAGPRAPAIETRDLEGVVVHVLAVLAADEVPAVQIVDVAIVVVVATIAEDFLRVRPEIGAQVDVRGIDAAVDDGDEYGARRASRRVAHARALGADAGNAVGGFVEDCQLRCASGGRHRRHWRGADGVGDGTGAGAERGTVPARARGDDQ